ncbi:META domain-containing protein [Streptomyces sp. NPDC005931]|uniref:META domain-containing protein n=1 Tax=Streptomyces sp. NPDC005931 TaxID=3364737 RepID=UPI003682DED7
MSPHRHQQRMTLTAVALLVPLVAACGGERAGGSSGSARTEDAVTGIRWSVDGVTVDGTAHRAPADAHLTVDDRGRAEGSYGCNTFNARADLDGDRIRLSDTMSTEMACGDQPMAFERTLARALTDGTLEAEVKAGRLTLTTGDGATVRLSRSEDRPLHGTRWRIDLPAADGRAHLTFDTKKGVVSGSLGCNHVNAEATVRDGLITLGTPSTTRMVCEDSLMTAEKTLLSLFDGSATYRIDHRNLTLTSDDGTEVTAFATE